MTAALKVVEAEETPAPAAEAEKAVRYEFDDAFQEKIVALALRDTAFAQRCDGLVDPDYFENEAHQTLVRLANDYYRKFRKAPDTKLLPTLLKKALDDKKIRKDMVGEVKKVLGPILRADISDRDYVIEEVSTFARHQAMTKAIMDSVALLHKRDFAKIAELTSKANLVGAQDDYKGYDYWDEEAIEDRTEKRKLISSGLLSSTAITTGYAELDKHLYHGGWARGELVVLMGPAKAGKSMSLGEFGKNASLAGHNVLYASCEVSTEIIVDRTDANVSDTAMKALKTTPMKVKDELLKLRAKAGKFIVHDFASGTLKVSQLRRLLERYRTRGIVFDMVIVDYADIMCPERDLGELRHNLNQIYLDLRAIAHEYNCALLTATQTNREGAKKMVATMTDVAEDFNKIRHADLVISINATEAEKAAGEARLYFAASRNQKEVTLLIKQDREKMKFLTKIISEV